MIQLKVLVAEDEKQIRKLVVEHFVADGFEVLEAWNGQEALKIAKEQPHLDLLVTDIDMPIMNGIEAARKIVEIHRFIKVVFVSGMSAQLAVREINGLGLFVRKPADLERLVSNCRKLCLK